MFPSKSDLDKIEKKKTKTHGQKQEILMVILKYVLYKLKNTFFLPGNAQKRMRKFLIKLKRIT